MSWLRSRRRRFVTVAVAGAVLLLAAAAVVYMVVFEDDDLPPGPVDDPEVTEADDVELAAIVSFADERLEFDYVITNHREERVAVVDPAVFDGGSADVFTEVVEGPWRYTARRETEPVLLELRRSEARRLLQTDGLLLQAGESRTGHVRVDGTVTDPPERIALCVEVVGERLVGETDEDGPTDPSYVTLAERTTDEPIEQACTGELPVN
jgi:hypothetical protein